MNLFAELHQLHLLRPWWLLAMLPALLLTFLLWRRRSSGGEWTRAIAPELLQPLLEQSAAPATRRWLPLLLGGWLLAGLALSGPAWQQLPQPVMQRSDALAIVLDLSLSMLTEDITPSRLQRARYKIQDVLAQRHEGTTALVAYAGSAHVVAPLTEDAATLSNLLPALSPETMPLRGSDPAAAIELAIELLQGAGEQRGRILLVSDGIRERDVDAVTALLDRRWQLSILGIGTLQGAPLPLDDGFARESDGSIAVPRLSREQFETLAQRSDGRYRELHADNSDIDALLATSALDLDATRRTGDTRQFDQWQDRGALLALLLLPLAALLFRRGWLLLVPLLLLPLTLLPASHAEAQAAEQAQSEAQPTTGRIEKLWRELWLRPDQQAARAFDAGDAARAARQFEDPRWRGAARYRAGDFAGAANDFAAGDNEATDGTADYNRGNALARAGKLQEALQAYDSALQANSQFDDASFNRALVEKLLQQQSQQSSQSPSEQQPQQPSQGQSQEQSGQQSQQRSQQQSQQDEESSSAAQQGQSSNQAEPSNSADREPSSDASSDQQKAPESPQQQRDEQQAGAQTDRDATSQPEQEGNDQNPASSAQAQAGEQEAEQSSQAESKADTLQQQREAARTEQWLRQIPDDPGGLLQRKFLYEQRLRERDGETRAAGQPAW